VGLVTVAIWGVDDDLGPLRRMIALKASRGIHPVGTLSSERVLFYVLGQNLILSTLPGTFGKR